MSKPVVEIHGVGKRYQLGESKQRYLSLREEIMRRLSPSARRARRAKCEFWALRHVDLSIQPGEAIGVIGRNGAGKSTLLKILSQITPPTEGKIVMRGRVGSLLEVGTGFHPELTGRENIFLNGAILGMRRAEIKRKFDEIVAFAEVEEFLDTPVKRYSSGMYVRLAFAVAGHLEPEILLVDEVLAVGDVAFQNKCLGKMGEVAHSGRTVLFVSHNMGMIAELCQRAVCLDHGQVRVVGPAREVIASYVESQTKAEPRWLRPNDVGKPRVSLQSVQLLCQKGEPIKIVDFNEPFQLELIYDVHEPVQGCTAVWSIDTAENLPLAVSSERDSTTLEHEVRKVGRYRAVCALPGKLLRHGLYHVTAGVVIENREIIDLHKNVLAFEVSAVGCPAMDGRVGVIAPVLPWRVDFLGRDQMGL
jgi:lipopolysaccharide transport system ATP-binding protein